MKQIMALRVMACALAVVVCVGFPAPLHSALIVTDDPDDYAGAAPENNPKTPVMRPHMRTTPSNDDYLPNYRPSDAKDDVAAHSTGHVVSDPSKSGAIMMGQPISNSAGATDRAVKDKKRNLFSIWPGRKPSQ